MMQTAAVWFEEMVAGAWMQHETCILYYILKLSFQAYYSSGLHLRSCSRGYKRQKECILLFVGEDKQKSRGLFLEFLIGFI